MIAVISGGTKGIGRAISELFLEKGVKVYISSRSIDKNFQHTNLRQFAADLSTKSGVHEFSEFIKRNEVHVDILVNNVGIFVPGSLMDEDDGLFELQLNTNLASTYHLTRALISELRKSNNAYIYNICSTASITPYINGGSYCISKYAQLGFTKVLREELKSEKIRVSAVLPGATMTNSWAGTDLPPNRFIKPLTIAQLIWSTYNLPKNTVMEELILRPLDGDIT